MNLGFKDICNNTFSVVIVVETTLHYISFLHRAQAEALLKSSYLTITTKGKEPTILRGSNEESYSREGGSDIITF